ncbi:WD40 repeat domain-containing protein [Nonomuraea angiospora]|uniref:WD40 repeat domain-containing protein n=1 Tax=Nonomuraea angiospora TaxID=46172 RepID=UPI00343FD2EA
MWDLTTGRQRGAPLTGHTSAVWSVATMVIGRRPFAISRSNDQTVRRWNLDTGNLMNTLHTDHIGWGEAVATAMIGDRPHAVTGSSDRSVRIWDLSTGRQAGTPLIDSTDPGNDCGPVESVTVEVVDGRPHAVTVNSYGTVRVWDLTVAQPADARLSGRIGWVRSVSTVLVDGRPNLISVGDDDKQVRVWDLSTGHPAGKPLTGHTLGVNAVTAVMIDGRPCAVSGGIDGTVRVWDLTTRQPLGKPLTGHNSPVRSVVTVTVDGRPCVVSGGNDGTARVWDLTTWQPIGKVLTGLSHLIEVVPTGALLRVTMPSDRVLAPVMIDGRLHVVIAFWPGGQVAAAVGRGQRPTGRPLAQRPQPRGAVGGHDGGERPPSRGQRQRRRNGVDVGSGQRPAHR